MARRVLAFHYAWHGTPWGPFGDWLGWKGHGYDPERIHSGGRETCMAHQPMDGVYDSGSEETIKRQIAQARSSGIDGFIISWWGREHYSDRVLDAFVRLSPPDFLTVYYETSMTFQARERSRQEAVDGILADLLDLCRRYGDESSWIRVDDRPLLAIYIPCNYTIDEWAEVKEGLAEAGHRVFLLADTFDEEYLRVMDGLHRYSPVGMYVNGEDIPANYSRASKACHEQGKLFAGTACPGYDDRKIRRPGYLVPRGDGSFYRSTWNAIREADAEWALICTFNEWYEGSEIEPSREFGASYLDQTRQEARAFKSSG